MKYMANILHAVFIAAPLALVGASGCVATTEDPDDLTQAEHTGQVSQDICPSPGKLVYVPGRGWVCVMPPGPPGGTTPAPTGN